MPEPDHVTAGVDGQHLRVHRDPEGVVDGARGSVHDSHQEIRRRVVAEHRRRRDDLRGVDRERIEPHRQHVGNRRGQAVGAVQVRVQQFRREERIATRSPPELIEEVLRGIDIGTGPDECAELVAFEAAELDAFDGGQARIGDQCGDRMATRQLGASVRPEQEHPLIEDVAHDVGEQLGRGLVRPLQVFEPERDRRSPGEIVEKVDERLHEHDRLDVELGRLPRQQGREHRLGGRHLHVLQQVVQRGAHGQEAQGRRQLDAHARADAETRQPAAVERGAEQCALPDPRLAADEEHPRPTTCHLGDGIVDPLQFRAATDERRSGPHGRGFYERPRGRRA